MGSHRAQDPLETFLMAQQAQLLECLMHFADGGGAPAIAKARAIVRALGEVETEILYPAFSRVHVPLDSERLLEDSRDSRARQLDALDALAHKRAPRLRKLAAVALADLIQHHGWQHRTMLVPALASRLPRAMYRSLAATFVSRCQRSLEPGAHAPPRAQRALVSRV